MVEGKTQLTKPTLPVYIGGVLACFIQDESKLIKYLRAIIVDMALYFAPLDSIRATFNELKLVPNCAIFSSDNNNGILHVRCDRKYHSLLVGVLRDLITHSSAQVRHYIAILLGVSASCMSVCLPACGHRDIPPTVILADDNWSRRSFSQ